MSPLRRSAHAHLSSVDEGQRRGALARQRSGGFVYGNDRRGHPTCCSARADDAPAEEQSPGWHGDACPGVCHGVCGARLSPVALAPPPLLRRRGATALSVLTVLLPALLLYHLQRVTGGMHVLTQHIARLTADRDLQVALLVLGLSPFIEALCGFGVGIIVIAPVLLELRLGAVRVAVLSLLGQLTTAWGATGVAVVLTASLTRLPVEQVGSLTALLSLPTALVLSLVCLQVSGGTAAALLTGGAWLLSRIVGVELMGLLSSTLTLALLGGVGALVSRRAAHARAIAHKGRKGEPKQDSFWLAATPSGIRGDAK